MNARQKAKKFKKENKDLRDMIYRNVRPVKITHNHMEVKIYKARAEINPYYEGLAESFAKRTIENGLFDEVVKHVAYKTIHEGFGDYLEGTIYLCDEEELK